MATLRIENVWVKCAWCEHMSEFKKEHEAHVKAQHLTNAPFKCHTCSFSANYKCLLIRHLNRKFPCKPLGCHTALKFHCPYCLQVSNSVEESLHHTKFSACNLKNKFFCALCDFECTGLADLELHFRPAHDPPPQSSTSSPVQNLNLWKYRNKLTVLHLLLLRPSLAGWLVVTKVLLSVNLVQYSLCFCLSFLLAGGHQSPPVRSA